MQPLNFDTVFLKKYNKENKNVDFSFFSTQWFLVDGVDGEESVVLDSAKHKKKNSLI